MRYNLISPNFIEFPILADEYIFGSRNEVKGEITRFDGDWRPYAPKYEAQYKNGFEPMSCTSMGTQNAISILLEEKYSIPDEDYAVRYTATRSGTTRQGNSPHKVAETIRKDGLLYEGRYPFSDDINTWEEYYAPVPKEKVTEGKKWLKDWTFKHDWVLTPSTNKAETQERIQDALLFSPIGIAVNAWVDENGVYFRKGRDNHWTLLVAMDKDYYYILDSYAPFIKKLSKDYGFSYAKRYSVVHTPKCWLSGLFGI